MRPKIRWKRLTTTATTPRKGYPGDAAYDLFYDGPENIVVGARATMIPTNVAAAIPTGHGGLLMGRSKLASKSITPLSFVLQDEAGRLRLGGCIDESYRGPIGFMVASIGWTGNDVIRPGDAVAQMWILPVPDLEDEDVGDGELPPGIRGERAYGSTDPVRPTSVFIPSIWAGPTIPAERLTPASLEDYRKAASLSREEFQRMYHGAIPAERPVIDVQGAPHVSVSGHTGVAARLVEEHNRHRNGAGLPALNVSRELTAAAQLHADDMARRRRMSHAGKDGSTVAARISYQGYRWRRAGENVAAGYRDVESVMKGWMASTGHRMNILGDFRDVGVGHAVARDGTPYWCVVFATAASVRAGREGEVFQSDDAITTPSGIFMGVWPAQVYARPWDMGYPPGSVGLEMKKARGRHAQIREDELGEHLRDVLDKFQNGSPIIISPGARLEQLTDFRARVEKACEAAAREVSDWPGPDHLPDEEYADFEARYVAGALDIITKHVIPALEIPKLGVVEDEAPGPLSGHAGKDYDFDGEKWNEVNREAPRPPVANPDYLMGAFTPLEAPDPGTPPDLAPDVVEADSGIYPNITEQVDGDQP